MARNQSYIFGIECNTVKFSAMATGVADRACGQDFVRWVQTCPADASDCAGREASLAEVRRMRLLLRGYAAAQEERREEAAAASGRDARWPEGTVRLILRGGEDALGDKLHYHPRMYRARRHDAVCDRLFDIEGGVLPVEEVDDEFCLSEEMPGCEIRLISINPSDAGTTAAVKFTEKTVRWKFDEGAWTGLYTYDPDTREPNTYWVVVFQDPKQREADLAKTRQRMEASTEGACPQCQEGEEGYFYGNNVGWVEGCSCLEGNPCTEYNKYNCKDWNNRYAVALAQGWSGKPP